MFIRKMATAYVTVMTIVLFFAWQYNGLWTEEWEAASDFAGWAVIVSIYAFPAVFIYGIAVSICIEIIMAKLTIHAAFKWVVSATLHLSFGFLCSLPFQSVFFGFIGAGAAFYFFLVDQLVIWCIRRLNRRTRVTLLAVPLVLFVFSYAALLIDSPAKPYTPPFSAEEAVHFATSGSGSTIDNFPKEIGTMQLEIQGYTVERETAVTPLGTKEQYRVAFIERWMKGSEGGEHRMYYTVTRGSLEAAGSDGPRPPYH
ncbi:hypothetical protein [Paenibacillus radicis (ex Gao et al. 2016)]|uniref:Uncharacterized protein n=1 Tax=Paenibacillus radicis (ex Gao et al. 2016) TaxID=1737354 RepID=A0A917GYT3_9BACL|nr:hypothetical protein [Paenibacillus radicis (ex Gao et al. 2016)]GGG61722.1 hypothetical protein GCM10010918_14100 [Paenibacillus radicis (ex Gao et al. 2016)]